MVVVVVVVVESFYRHYCVVFWVPLAELPFYRGAVAAMLSAPHPCPAGSLAAEAAWELQCQQSQPLISAVEAQVSAPHLCPEVTAAQEVEWGLLVRLSAV